jgi:hypothetical protein
MVNVRAGLRVLPLTLTARMSRELIPPELDSRGVLPGDLEDHEPAAAARVCRDLRTIIRCDGDPH